jgi:hypothetical protein
MLHPNNYRVDETWVAFQLNDAPIPTEQDGDFNCLVLMDAASCYIVSSAMISAEEAEPSLMESKRMLKQGKEQNGAFPLELLIPEELCARVLAAEAERQGIGVVRLPESELRVYTEETRKVFRKKFGR